MAYNQLATVKAAVAAGLAAVMPVDEQTNEVIPVHYAWPGQQHQRPTHVWLAGGRAVSDPAGMVAGRKRRDQRWSFDVIIECARRGQTVDDTGTNVLQRDADEIVEEIAGLVDEWVAANPKLGQTTTNDVHVDYGLVDSFTLEHGPTPDGVAARMIVTLTYRIRPR